MIIINSEERKEARYQRRKAKRQEKEYKINIQFDDFNNVCGIDVLLDSAYKSRKSASWKTSTQKFHINLLRNCITYSNKLKNGENINDKLIFFTINERGKIRNITSTGFPERVIHKALSKNVLVPILSRSLIYDNGASIEDKGYSFSIDRLKYHLSSFYRENGFSNNGWILLMDIKNYFGSISHDKLKEEISTKIHDEKLLNLIYSIIDEIDVGLALGFEPGQIEALFFPSNKIDHYIKDKKSFKRYARHADDSYVISNSKEELIQLRDQLIDKYKELGLELNMNKTKIIKLDDPQFKYLKNRVKLDNNGKVIIRPDKKSIQRMRVKLSKFKKMYDNGTMSFERINTSYQSWRGFMSRKDCYETIRKMDKLFYEYFVKDRKNHENKQSVQLKRPKKNVEEFQTIQDETNFSCKRIEDNFYDSRKTKTTIKYNKLSKKH